MLPSRTLIEYVRSSQSGGNGLEFVKVYGESVSFRTRVFSKTFGCDSESQHLGSDRIYDMDGKSGFRKIQNAIFSDGLQAFEDVFHAGDEDSCL
jgi:hypothetical protein